MRALSILFIGFGLLGSLRAESALSPLPTPSLASPPLSPTARVTPALMNRWARYPARRRAWPIDLFTAEYGDAGFELVGSLGWSGLGLEQYNRARRDAFGPGASSIRQAVSASFEFSGIFPRGYGLGLRSGGVWSEAARERGAGAWDSSEAGFFCLPLELGISWRRQGPRWGWRAGLYPGWLWAWYGSRQVLGGSASEQRGGAGGPVLEGLLGLRLQSGDRFAGLDLGYRYCPLGSLELDADGPLPRSAAAARNADGSVMALDLSGFSLAGDLGLRF